jgi:hypothetical protein
VSSSLTWGTVAPPPPTASLDPANGLQPIVNAFGVNGGTLKLPKGTFYADPANPLTPLSMPNDGVEIVGLMQQTIIGSPVLWSAGDLRLKDLTVRPIGGAYGVKLYKPHSGATQYGVPRCNLENVWIGAVDAGSRDAGQGPANGLWLDGAILLIVDRCTFAFNSLSGVFMDTTDTPGTNENRFRGCTMNLNSRFGVEVVGSAVEGVRIHGGNMEDNSLGAVLATSCNQIDLEEIDFELNLSDIPGQINDIIAINSSGPSSIIRCNFNVTGGAALRAWTMATSTKGIVRGNSHNGFPTFTPVGIFDPNCSGCRSSENIFGDAGTFILNKGQL